MNLDVALGVVRLVLVHAAVGEVHEGFAGGGLSRPLGHPQRAGDVKRYATDHERAGEDRLGTPDDLFDVIVALDAGHDEELVPALAKDAIVLAEAAYEAIGHGSEELVADDVAMGVVDVLEVVEVEEHQGDAIL